MATVKTKQTTASVGDFINSFADTDQKRKDAFELVDIISNFTGYEAKMWGPSIIGFGVYHYKSDKSKQEADWPLVAFSPRKAAISLYTYSNTEKNQGLLEKLGKFKKGKGCIYVKKLSDINVDILKEMIAETINFVETKYGKVS
ncbi:DUF1801 domain-containing protein [Nubsella zeaxanthinifaciens]|uniref:DUF1801 domain-containing protein n=1 Tax=Nubsella zeaxanthinifaciens TaxID=392412 RepID=UPI000DE551DA|nr:DUF1801 domain-containing protein [Nubsella zeaxanthinifaciens]